ncbi:hypothetical protein BA723_07475 [Helicobacter sp. CLO-3]|uniref:FapA family protein n=1 Tax=Helicobacter sp. CLO-3 TaxID=211 RepID=UPI000805AF01|nr:FapA family protein [Helicobacter sp. CLO-3]OBV28930.1 hypothetical protein BA723_07475 [Helicobacter sp. CLO-3]
MSFTPFVITGCEDIQASINERCAAMGIDADMVEFMLVDFTLLVCADSKGVDSRSADSGKSGAFKPLSKAESSQLDIQAQYNQSLFLLKQKCDVRVFPRRFPATFFITVSAQKDRVFLSFDDGFLCVDDASFYEEFFSQVEAMMAANGVILYDLANTRARIREVLARINADPKAKSGMFCIKQSEVFIPPKSARFVFLPKERYLKSRYIQSLMQTESIAEHTADMDSDAESHAKSSTESSDLDSSANADSSQNAPNVLNAPHTLSAPESSAPQTLAKSNADYLDDAKFACAFFGVREGEVVGVYEFGDEGKAGRDLTGAYRKAAPKPPKITPSAQKHIAYKLYDDRIEYISEVQGYIALHSAHTAPFASADVPRAQIAQNSAANIKDEGDNSVDSVFVFFLPDSAPLKSTTTPPLLGGIEAGISLVIESKSDAIDALGDNIHIEAKSIEIYGSLGKDTAIKADELIINGATHHSSKIHAKIAKILTHKGLMICEKCTIKNLESAKVFADDARVIQANGSKIYAKNISIKALRNNNHCHFSKTLQIQEIPYNKGNDNMLAFDIKGDRELRAYIKRALKYANDKQSTLKILALMIDFYAASTRDAQVFLQKLQGFTKDQQEIALKNQDFAAKNLASINAIKLYKALLTRQKSLKKRLETLQDKTLPSLQTALKNATIQIGLVGGFENYAHLECDFPRYSQNMLLLSGKSACVRLEPASQELKEKGIYFQLKAEE